MNPAPIWLFDLDNTLHNASPHIFPHLNQAMTAYLQQHLRLSREEADALRRHYWLRYGATLLGLVRHHGTDPAHFLAETHRFEALHTMVVFERALRALLRRLPGRKYVFSNGPQHYAEAVLNIMRLRRPFAAVFGIERMGYLPKPYPQAYRRLLHSARLNPHRCILVEDSLENLRTAKQLGMRTVWVSRSPRAPACVDVKIANILDLQRATRALRSPAAH